MPEVAGEQPLPSDQVTWQTAGPGAEGKTGSGAQVLATELSRGQPESLSSEQDPVRDSRCLQSLGVFLLSFSKFLSQIVTLECSDLGHGGRLVFSRGPAARRRGSLVIEDPAGAGAGRGMDQLQSTSRMTTSDQPQEECRVTLPTLGPGASSAKQRDSLAFHWGSHAMARTRKNLG